MSKRQAIATGCRRPLRGWYAVLGAVWLGAGVWSAQAQFLRIGPFDFNAKARLEGIYSSNVEQERQSQAKSEREDYYGVVGLDMMSKANVAPNTQVNVDTGISVERHVRRPDLNNSENPFGRVNLNSATEFGRFILTGRGRMERTSESAEELYVPGDKKTTDPRTEYEGGAGLNWTRNRLGASAFYTYTAKRHEKDEYKADDQNERTFNFNTTWQVWRYNGVYFNYERKKTEFLHKERTPGSEGEETDWEETREFGMSGAIPVRFIRRPEITYSFGMESKKGNKVDDDAKWKPTHTVGASDKYDFSSSLSLAAHAQYENKIHEDTVTFQYNFDLVHQLSPSARQRLGVMRKPVDTFGSTDQTDETDWTYVFTKTDLFIYNLTFNFDASYKISRPMGPEGGETEKTTTYNFTLDHSRALTRRVERRLGYKYHWERSNLIGEVLDEHRVTLSFIYTF